MRNEIKRFFVAVLAACGLAVSAALAAPSYQAQLTVQGYDGAELANFPVLVRLSPQTVDGFDYADCLEDGSDVVFVDEIGEPLAYQLDTWNPSGESLFWVKLPQLAKGKSFFVQWGGEAVPSDASRTWNDSYAGVWHMGEADGVCRNSTGHGSAYDATPKGATAESVRYDGTDAPVGGARTTAKTNKAYLSVPNYDALQFDGTFTISGWVRLEGTSGYARLFSRKTTYTETGWEVEAQNGSMKSFTARGDTNNKYVSFTLPESGLSKNWVHFAFVYDKELLSVYGDGKRLAQGAIHQALDNGLPFSIGCNSNGSEAFAKGAFDECRLMGGAASADWVKAEYDTVKKADFLTYGERVTMVIDPSLGIRAVRVAASGDSFVDLRATLTGLGENATEASIQLAYGFDETSLVKTQTVWTATAPSHMTLRLARLLPQRVYCVQVVAVNNLGERAVSDPIRVMTAASQDASGNVGDLLAIRVDEVVANGALEKLTLTFPPAEEARDLYVAWGAEHGGATTNGWTHVQKLTTVAPGCGTHAYDLPVDWGEEDNRVIRFFFFLNGTLQSCSSSVYWRDCSEPLITGLSLDGRGGDTLKVTGSLASFAGSSCTLKVLVGQTPEALDQVWTGLPGSVRQSTGSFALTLCSKDTGSSKYLAPGETYYVCVEATAGGSVSRSQVKQVTMAKEDAIGSATASVTRRTVTFSGVLAGRGMGGSAKVSLWVSEENNEGSLKKVVEELDVKGGAFSFTHTFPEFEQTYYWQLRAVSTSAGGTATAETRTAVASYTTADTATYTWQGGEDGDWENPANWGNSGGDAFGYPNGPQTVVNFPAGTKARIVLHEARSVQNLYLDKPGIEVTFARAPGQAAGAVELEVKNPPSLTGTRLRLALDGVALRSGGTTTFTAFDGEVRLSNGASWYLDTRLENVHGGRLWLGPGTSLSCSDYWFGGGLTVIDDATLEVRGSALLGTNKDGGKIRFVGTHPAFRCSAQGAQVRSNLETANVRLEFALPAGGYTTPPFVNASAQPSYIFGYNDNDKRLWPIWVDIAPDSPAAFVQGTTETTLIRWGKGICRDIIQTGALPGADDAFVWSETTEGENPVSLGVSLVGSTHANELHMTGSPEEVVGDGLAPGYGVKTVERDSSIECVAPAGTLQLSDTKRATCVGWKLYAVDAATRARTLVGKGPETTYTYTNTDGLWHELVWQWKVEYRVTATTDGNGTASVESEWVETGKRARVTVTPKDGYAFGKWTGDVPADHDKDFELMFTVRDRAYAFEASFLPAYYVSPSGSDDNDGRSLATAFATIEKALGMGSSDSPVCALLDDGTYEVTEQIVIANGSTVAGANPGAKAVVKLMKPLSAGAAGSVFKLAHADARLYNVTVTTDYVRGDSSKNDYGAARNGNFGRGVWIEQAGLVDSCVITNCGASYGNNTSGGGGVYLKGGGIVRRTLLTHNRAYGNTNVRGHNALLDGGGLIESCRLVWGGSGVTEPTGCGGVYSKGGTVRNSLVAYNTQVTDDATIGIAVHLIGGVMENCTVAGNFHLTSSRTPAVYAKNIDNSAKNDPVIRNCVIWGNTGFGADVNWGLEAGRYVVSSTCAMPQMPGEGNIEADPCFANPGDGNFQLTLSSAVDAGVPLDWMDWTGDLDGNDRQQGAAPDMGCYEFAPSAFSCGLDVSAGGAFDRDEITLTARVAGDDLEGLSYAWTLTNERGFTMVTNTTDASLTLPLTSGLYTIDLSVKKGEAVVGTVTRPNVVRVNQKNFYVATNGADTYPYDTLANAARDFNTVLALAVHGAVIHVAPGWYRPADGLTVAKGVTIVADDGPEETFLFAPMTTANQAMVTVKHAGAVLSGLTVTGKDENGNQPQQWGGLRVTAGVVTNCVISHHRTKGNTVNGAGCRLEGGTVVDCTFINNFCEFSGTNSRRGGAVTLEVGDALLDRCTVISNRVATSSASANSPVKDDTYAYGGGVYLSVGTVRNSLVVGNESHAYGGGIAVEGTGRVLNCTVVGNKARLASGGIWQGGGTVRDCLCLGNVAHGVVDAADDPGFVDAANGDYRLNPASAAIDAADGADLGGLDRAGRPRVSGAQADKGCYEWDASQTDFGISFRKLTPFAPGEVEFSAKAANGTLSDCRWMFDGGEQKTGATVTNSFPVGSVSVSFRANLNGETVSVDKPNWFVAYGETVHVVVENENSVFPYATWETAATNLNDAFAAVQRDGTILMGAGEYPLTDERTIDFPMTLRGANGPERTVLDAQAKLRPFQLRHPSAVLDGLTLRNGRGGASSLGGGVAIRNGGQVTNCVFDACIGDVVAAAGVGVQGRGAQILDCRFEGCWVDDDWPNRTRKGVAILTSGPDISEEDLLIDRCLVRGSHEGCSRSGKTFVACADGAIWIDGGTVRNTIVTGSVLRGCGGIIATGTAKVENCTIVGNVSTNTAATVAGLRIDAPWGSGKFDVKVYNTIVWDNRWNDDVKNVGGADGYASRLKNCWTEGDPKLRGSGKFAFRPTSGSPCIDAGSQLPWMDDAAVDVYGRPRKQGKGPDIGAAEFSSAGFMILVR